MLRARHRPIALGLAVSFVLASASVLSTGCFYDSTWGARKTAQRHNAALATPASLTPAPAESSAPAPSDGVVALHVRVHAAPAYEAQTPDWRAHVGAILDEASVTLQATIGGRFVLEAADDWNHVTAPHLTADLAALRDDDTGDGVDLVLGLVGGLPMATESFDQIGLSELRGKHMVVRAPNVASEYEAVEKAFDELGVEQRTRLRRERIRHREVAVILHEVGHALGAEHTTAAASLMRPVYDPKMAGFDDASIAEMRRGLAHETAPAKSAEVAHLASSAEPAAAKAPDAPAELSAPDRARWSRAADLSKAGDAQGAWDAARPLFTTYPRVYEVQDLRCKLALAHFASYADARTECAALMNVSMTKGAKTTAPAP